MGEEWKKCEVQIEFSINKPPPDVQASSAAPAANSSRPTSQEASSLRRGIDENGTSLLERRIAWFYSERKINDRRMEKDETN